MITSREEKNNEKEWQEFVLDIKLHAPLNENEIRMLYQMSLGKPMSQIRQEGLGGQYYSESTLYGLRKDLSSKLKTEIGKGSRKLIWIAGRYHIEIETLFNQLEKSNE